MGAKKRRPTGDELSKLNNNQIPSVTLRKALKAFKEGDVEEADRIFNFHKKGTGWVTAKDQGKR